MNKEQKEKLFKWLDAQAYTGVICQEDGNTEILSLDEMKKYLPAEITKIMKAK